MNPLDLDEVPVPIDTEKVLRTLVTDFSVAPLSNGKRMRDLLKVDRDAFSTAALSVLGEILDERGTRYLVTLLWTNGVLMETLANQSLPKEVSLRVAQTAAKVDTQLYIRLMRYLVEGMLETHRLEEGEASRLLEVLAVIAEGGGLQPFLRQMLLHPSPRIRSKITLLLGRGQAGFRALERLLQDDDPRVRANAIEALWNSQLEQSTAILRNALGDTNNRVLGNAILGLHLAGDPICIPSAIRLAQYPSPIHRATAAWAIGKTADPRFLPFLGRMLIESDGQTRKTIFHAIEILKKAQISRSSASRLSVAIFECKMSGPKRASVMIVVTDRDGATIPQIVGTQIIASQGNNSVMDYTSTEFGGEQFILAWVVPRRPSAADPLRLGVEDAMRRCLDMKRRPEQWCITRFRPTTSDTKSSAALTFLGHSLVAPGVIAESATATAAFTANKVALRTGIESPGLRYDTGDGPLDSIHGVITGQVPSRGLRHVIAVLDDAVPTNESAAGEVLKAAIASGFKIHAVSLTPNPMIAEICTESGGSYREVRTPERASEEIGMVYAALARRYVIEFDCEPSANAFPPSPIRVQVVTPQGVGEATWDPTAMLEQTAPLAPQLSEVPA